VRVSGEIRFPPLKRPLREARVRVRVDDVSSVDAPARTLAETEAGPVSAAIGEACRIPFTVEVDDSEIDPRAHYVVAAHADLDGDGEVSVGDYVTMESYPVLTRGNSASAEVEVREVK
jgi:uncharacterized lipoprotein YbaY